MASIPTSPQTDRKKLEEGLKLMGNHQYEHALATFESMAEPNMEPLKHYHRGLALVQLGRLDDALIAYKNIRIIPDNVDGVSGGSITYGMYINMGSIMQVTTKKKGQSLNRGLLEEAVTCYKYALQMDASDARVWNNLGNAHLDLEDYPKAIDAFKKAITLDSERPEIHYCLSLAYEFSTLYEAAVGELEKALDLRPGNKAYLNRAAAISFGTGKMAEAKKFVEKIIETDPKDRDALKNMVLILYNLKEYDAAFAYYERLLAVDPQFKDKEVIGIFDDLKGKKGNPPPVPK